MDQIKLSKDFRYLLFTGSGRTGSTLIGQLLNNHPEILISNEIRALNYCLDNSTKLSNLIENIANRSYDEYLNGTLKYDQNHSKKSREVWQRDWVDISKIKKIEKKNINFIGDKKQGGNSELLSRNPELLNFIDVSFLPISVVRHPERVFSSYFRVNNDLDKSIETTIKNMTFGYEFVLKHKGVILNYDSLLKDSSKWCMNVYEKLGLQKNQDWEDIVKKSLNSDKKELKINDEYLNSFRSHQGYNRLMEFYNNEK